VPGNFTLGRLHLVIQIAMGWKGGHLHEFTISGEQYGDPQWSDDVENENRMTLAKLVQGGVTRFGYTYDFGDDWDHVITLEKKLWLLPPGAAPLCIGGERNCPPENCGGVWGYESLIQIMADPKHPEHAEMADWLEEELDPEAFDITTINLALAGCFTD
jgi:hypothetical protein